MSITPYFNFLPEESTPKCIEQQRIHQAGLDFAHAVSANCATAKTKIKAYETIAKLVINLNQKIKIEKLENNFYS